MKELENAVENLKDKIEHLETLSNNSVKRLRKVSFISTIPFKGPVKFWMESIGLNKLELLGILDVFREDLSTQLRLNKGGEKNDKT